MLWVGRCTRELAVRRQLVAGEAVQRRGDVAHWCLLLRARLGRTAAGDARWARCGWLCLAGVVRDGRGSDLTACACCYKITRELELASKGGCAAVAFAA